MLFDNNASIVSQALQQYGEFTVGVRELFSQLLSNGTEVVEFGSGIGVMSVEIAKHVGSNGRVWAENREPQEFLLLCANLALNEVKNVEFFDSISDIDLPDRCDMVVINDTPWTTELENIVTNKLSRDRPFIMTIGEIDGIEALRNFPNYLFVEYWVEVARPDNFKGTQIDEPLAPILCLVGAPS